MWSKKKMLAKVKESGFRCAVTGMAGEFLAREQAGFRRLVIDRLFDDDKYEHSTTQVILDRINDFKEAFPVSHTRGKAHSCSLGPLQRSPRQLPVSTNDMLLTTQSQ